MKQDFNTLHLDNISRHFFDTGKEFPALSELTIDIKRGEFVTFLGPSGCGKSTALNCVVGLFPLTGGQILLDDERIDHLPPEKRGFGMVFQNYALFPHMTVADNVGFGLLMRKVPKEEIKNKVRKALQLVQLEDQWKKLPGQLSGGQQQRVAIARAIVIEPPLILMDEPLSNLDAKLRLEMRSEIKGIHQELGLSTIYVTHDQEEALSMADRIVVIDKGKSQQIASPQEVYSAPSNIKVARFMGYRTVLEMDVVSASGGQAVLSGRGLSLTAKVMQPLSGKKALVAVRPEDFKVGNAVVNVIDALIKNVEYVGFSSQVDLLTDKGDIIHMRTHELLKGNTRIKISVPPERVLAYPAEEDR
ncbi:MAG: ABC transporter ATP-binding protein [Treponema sp.]|nr:ABC transporter ATP-binding protein [Treponema sp.]